MKSRPMIFSAPMVRAILADQKTQTRRVVKGVPASHDFAGFVLEHTDSKQDGKAFFGIQKSEYHYDQIVYVRCPYGVVGDRLWVREKYTYRSKHDKYYYFADHEGKHDPYCHNGWETPLFMPRAASRIELEITDIRVERVQDISEADARSEGITDGGCLSCGNPEPCGCCNPKPDARDSYIWLWHKINGKKHPWSSNPWVWVVEFKRVEVQS